MLYYAKRSAASLLLAVLLFFVAPPPSIQMPMPNFCFPLPSAVNQEFTIVYPLFPAPGPSEYPIGTVGIYVCSGGAPLVDGDIFRTCSANGNWTGTEAVCRVPGCPDIADPDNGNIDFQGDSIAPFDVGTTAVYSCDEGYRLVGQPDRECLTGIEDFWNGTAPFCQGITCSPIEDPANGSVQYSEEQEALGGYSFDVDATFTCFNGHGLVGPSSSSCTEGGMFSPAPPSCELIRCPALNDPINGQVRYGAVSDLHGNFPFQTVATYSCDSGHFLVGETLRVCTGEGISTEGYFSGMEPMCQEITCSALNAPENGYVTFSSNTEGPYDIGVIATYGCEDGFSLENGNEERACQQAGDNNIGVWHGMAPECIGELE